MLDKLAASEKVIQERLIASSVVHADESGIRCDGKLHWFHVASNSLYTLLFALTKRGKDAIESEPSILFRFTGWLVHDCWSSYFNLTHLKHAICGAQLLKELQGLMDLQSKWAVSFKEFLLEIYKSTMDDPLEKRLEQKSVIEQKYDKLLMVAEKKEPLPEKNGKRGKLKRTKGRNLLERLQKLKPAVLAFVFYDEVPFTNN